MNYLTIKSCDMINGTGCRVSLWVSGCECHCPMCYSPHTWHPKCGKLFDQEAEDYFFECLSSPFIKGATYTGGHPLAPYNIDEVTRLMKKQKEILPNKDIWCWTGLLYEDIKDLECMQYIDILVDGRFVVAKFNSKLKWRGSENQRIIDVKASREQGEIVLHPDNNIIGEYHPEDAWSPLEDMTPQEIKEKYIDNICEDEGEL